MQLVVNFPKKVFQKRTLTKKEAEAVGFDDIIYHEELNCVTLRPSIESKLSSLFEDNDYELVYTIEEELPDEAFLLVLEKYETDSGRLCVSDVYQLDEDILFEFIKNLKPDRKKSFIPFVVSEEIQY